MTELYRISGERLTGIAEQARRLGNVSGSLTPAQIEDTLKGVTTGGGVTPDGGGATFSSSVITELPTVQQPRAFSEFSMSRENFESTVIVNLIGG